MTLKKIKKSKTNALMLLALFLLLYKLVHLNLCLYIIAHRQYSPVQFFYCNIWNDTAEMIIIIIFYVK